MDNNFVRADSLNLPRMDTLMLAAFFATNPNMFCSEELRNSKTAASSCENYGDDCIGFVQLCRESGLCVLKCKVCPENTKEYIVTLNIDEDTSKVVSVQCHNCETAFQGGCKHSLAFLMWVHRRSEEPSGPSVECYWKMSKLAQAASSVKFIKAKELSKDAYVTSTSSDHSNEFLKLFLAEAKKRNINCPLLRYQPDYEFKTEEFLSLHILSVKYNKKFDCDKFLDIIQSVFAIENIKLVESKTRDQHKNPLWHELRYGRITADKAYEVCHCKKTKSLVEVILGADIINASAANRRYILKEKVINTVEKYLKLKIEKCGLFISQEHPMIATSPDGILHDANAILEIKCPKNEQAYKKFINNGKISAKFKCQMQMQMNITGMKNGFFCVADPEFEKNNKFAISKVVYDETSARNTVNKLISFWRTNIYPVLYQSTITE